VAGGLEGIRFAELTDHLFYWWIRYVAGGNPNALQSHLARYRARVLVSNVCVACEWNLESAESKCAAPGSMVCVGGRVSGWVGYC
jgi:hypothetical protein